MKRRTMLTFKQTIKLFTTAESRVPLMRSNDAHTITNAAGRFTIPETIVPSCSFASAKGESIHGRKESASSWLPRRAMSLLRYPAQLIATVAAATAYSSTKSHPIIHATSSPIVA